MNRKVVPFNDLSRIHENLESDFISETKQIVSNSAFVLGQKVVNFESQYASLEQANFCVGVDNGTNSIELMLRAVGVSANDEVITSAMTFIATIFAIERIGAIPVLVDTLPNSPLMDYSQIQRKISKRTKAILMVTLHGRIEYLNEFQEIASKNNLILLIDGAQSHLGRFQNLPLVNFADAVSTSFYPGKNLGSLGEGGAVLTNSQEIAEKIKLYRDWGAKEKYMHDSWGGNFRLHSIQAAFLTIKLRHLTDWTAERKQIGNRYLSEITNSVVRPPVQEIGDHVYHIFDIRVSNRLKAISVLEEHEIAWGIHYPKAVSSNKAFQHLGKVTYQNATEFADTTLSIPLFPGMLEEEIARVISAVNSIAKSE